VNSYYSKHCDDNNAQDIQSCDISKLIDKLRHNASPAIDLITAEHLQFGKCEILCSVLVSVYNAILSYCHVPSSFTYGIIVPVLKKTTLNPNLPENYRPITVSSVLSKILELLIIPNADICDTQFGFRKAMGTVFGCTLLSDVLSYFKYQQSPVYTCSLEQNFLFDNICHTSLFYKLINVIPSHHWILCFRWYSRLSAVVKWQGDYSSILTVTKGT